MICDRTFYIRVRDNLVTIVDGLFSEQKYKNYT